MITEFGKFIRKLRIDETVTLRKMADDLGLSPAYLSSVETGKKKITGNYLDAVVSYFQLSGEAATEVKHLAAISQKELTMSLEKANQKQKNSAVMFARRLNTLTDDEIEKLNLLLEK